MLTYCQSDPKHQTSIVCESNYKICLSRPLCILFDILYFLRLWLCQYHMGHIHVFIYITQTSIYDEWNNFVSINHSWGPFAWLSDSHQCIWVLHGLFYEIHTLKSPQFLHFHGYFQVKVSFAEVKMSSVCHELMFLANTLHFDIIWRKQSNLAIVSTKDKP